MRSGKQTLLPRRLFAKDGCDSTVTLDLEIFNDEVISQTVTINNGDSLFVGGDFQTTAGSYSDTSLTSEGCQKVVVTELQINVSIKDWNIANIAIYPNPVDDMLYVELPNIDGELTLQVLNLQGKQLISKQPANTTKTELSLQHLSPGIYLLQMSDQQGNYYHEKIVVQ